MERVAEPELMDEQEQAAAYAAADWSEAHGKIPGYFLARFPQFTEGRVIDLGCGPADVTIRFVRAFPNVTAVGVDASEAMLGFGRQAVRAAGLDKRISLEKRYLPDAALETRGFDAVVSNSLLHHLADPLTLWATAARSAKPGAPVLVVDLLRPPDHASVERLVAEHAKDAPGVLQRDFIASLHAAYTSTEVRQQLQAADLTNFEVEEVDVLHFVAWGPAPK
jgi:ubiquinone/menaquinone biosynthesis C-methylase UbiE